MQFYVEGKKVHDVGYRAHLAMLALLSGIDKLYAENSTKKGVKERVAVYVGAEDERRIDRFRQQIKVRPQPKGAKITYVSKPKPYRSDMLLPAVVSYASALTAGEVSEGRSGIEGLTGELVGLRKESREGFEKLPKRITDDLVRKLPAAIGQSVGRSISRELRRTAASGK